MHTPTAPPPSSAPGYISSVLHDLVFCTHYLVGKRPESFIKECMCVWTQG